jgi:hypothetical protein
MPDLVGVVSPDTEAELTAIVEMLEAHDIPCFVCDARPSWVSSGVHGYMRKPRTIMVPRTRVAEAAGLIGDLESSRAALDDGGRNHLLSRLYALVRSIWFGWHRPVSRNFK